MKWYLEPSGTEFTRWNPRAFQSVLRNVSFNKEEPTDALIEDDWQLYPLVDNRPVLPGSQTISSRSITVSGGVATVQYVVRDLTEQEIEEREEALRPQRQREAQEKATAIINKQQIATQLETFPPEVADGLAYVFDAWSGSSVVYEIGDVVEYKGNAYRTVQGHTSQPSWTPPTVPALFTPVRAVSGPNLDRWVQPTGAQDAYATGDRVIHDNPNDSGNDWVYESAIPANTQEPGRDGTFDRWWTPVEAV